MGSLTDVGEPHVCIGVAAGAGIARLMQLVQLNSLQLYQRRAPARNMWKNAPQLAVQQSVQVARRWCRSSYTRLQGAVLGCGSARTRSTSRCSATRCWPRTYNLCRVACCGSNVAPHDSNSTTSAPWSYSVHKEAVLPTGTGFVQATLCTHGLLIVPARFVSSRPARYPSKSASPAAFC